MEPSGMDNIKRYLQLIHKRKHVVIITAVSIITVFVMSGYFLPKVYEATSTVFIERDVIKNLVKGIAVTPSMEERLRVLLYSIKSRGLLLKVLKDLDIDINTKDQAEIDRIIEMFQEKTNIDMKASNKDEMDLFIVSFRDKDPRLARDYVNTLVRQYIEENLSAKREEAYGATRFLSEQLDFFKNKLDKIDAEIVDFRKEKGIFVVMDERRIVEEIKDAQERLEELKIHRMELEAKRDLMKKQIEDENPYTVAIFGRRSNTLNDRLFILQNRLNELLVDYTENYPEVLMVKAEIESLKERLENGPKDSDDSQSTETEMSTLSPIYLELKGELAKTGLELVALTAREEHLKKLIESKKTYLRDMPAEKKKLADLEREKNTYKKIHDELTLRFGQSEVSKQMEVQDKAVTFRIVDPAVLPTKPVSPNRVKIILLGLFAGLAGGFGIVLLLDSIDNSVKTVDALKTLGLPVLAIIPRIQSSEDLMKIRKKNILLYSLAGLYMLCILGVFTMELIGLTYLDDFVQQYLIGMKDTVKGIF